MPALRTLIVDDEPLGRERVATLLTERSEHFVVEEASDGAEAVSMLEATAYDLVFLDIQMPNRSGIEVVRAIGVDRMPPVVFVTAYDEYAIRAFEVHALDYLLKPFEPERFHEAVDRVAALVRTRDRGDLELRVQRLLDDMDRTDEPLRRLMVKNGARYEFVNASDIDWIEAAGNYVTLHIGRRSLLLRQTMKTLDRRLDADRFIRIHRSTIVNLDRVRELYALSNGDHEVRLEDGTRLVMSRTYRDAMNRFA